MQIEFGKEFTFLSNYGGNVKNDGIITHKEKIAVIETSNCSYYPIFENFKHDLKIIQCK